MADHDMPNERPSSVARLRLERTVVDEVQRLASAFDAAFLEAERLLQEGDTAGADDAIERQRQDLMDTDARLRRAVADAMVERAAEDVMAEAAQRLQRDASDDAPVEVAPVPHTPPTGRDAPQTWSQRTLARVPMVAAAAAALAFGLLTFSTGPRDVELDAAGSLGSDNTPSTSASDVDSPPPLAPFVVGPQGPLTNQDDTLNTPSSAADVGDGPGTSPTVAPEILDLVNRVLSEATSTVFEEVAQSPLLDEVAGDDLEAALELLEQRLADGAGDETGPVPTETTEPDADPSGEPSESPTDGEGGLLLEGSES